MWWCVCIRELCGGAAKSGKETTGKRREGAFIWSKIWSSHVMIRESPTAAIDSHGSNCMNRPFLHLGIAKIDFCRYWHFWDRPVRKKYQKLHTIDALGAIIAIFKYSHVCHFWQLKQCYRMKTSNKKWKRWFFSKSPNGPIWEVWFSETTHTNIFGTLFWFLGGG